MFSIWSCLKFAVWERVKLENNPDFLFSYISTETVRNKNDGYQV